ncbi:MAG TPA: hypothetical protein VF766_11765 [Pyrinomonadaceae bacterium]
MGIANELSTDVAAAVLARKDQPSQAGTKELIEIVRNFHSAMRDLRSEERRHARGSFSTDPPQAGSQAASG